ncbi:MAG: ABC transporter ATP-binding protein [Alphaproteobacteria bacterium]|nr:ABC transporter ATP-binding protein [Alphaproteobacteria bacterium]
MSFLTVRGLRKEFGPSVAVQDFSLVAERGEFVSLLGPSGCGKTTVLRMIAGFETPTAGAVVIEGEDVTRLPARARRIGMVFQSYALFPNLTVEGNIAFGLKVAGMERDEVAQRVKEMLDLIGLPKLGGRYPVELSGGQQQRVALARAIAIRPRILLLDEPLSALDAKIRVSLREELRAIQRELGITALFVTHDQEEALALSHRVVVMNEGRVEQIGTPAGVYRTPRTPFVATFVGTANVLPCRIEDAAAGRLAFGAALLDAGQAVPGAAGETVQMALRPEAVALHEFEGGHNRLAATVRDVTFLGPVARLRVLLDGDVPAIVDLHGEATRDLPEPGAALDLYFRPESLQLLDRRDAGA